MKRRSARQLPAAQPPPQRAPPAAAADGTGQQHLLPAGRHAPVSRHHPLAPPFREHWVGGETHKRVPSRAHSRRSRNRRSRNRIILFFTEQQLVFILGRVQTDADCLSLLRPPPTAAQRLESDFS